MYRVSFSFIVNAEHDSGAEEGTVSICERSIVVIVGVPETFRGNAHSLSVDLANNGLNDDFIAVNAQLFHRVLNIVCELLCQELGLLVVIDFLIG